MVAASYVGVGAGLMRTDEQGDRPVSFFSEKFNWYQGTEILLTTPFCLFVCLICMQTPNSLTGSSRSQLVTLAIPGDAR